MRVLLLGGSGIVGRAAIKDLVAQDDVSEVVVADLNTGKAKRYLKGLGSNKVSVISLDVSNHTRLVETMRGFDVVGNCVYWKFLIPISKAAIEAKTHVVDLGGMFYETVKQMDLDGSAKESGVTLLSSCGSGPGINNVLARYGAEKLDRVDAIDIWAGAVAPSAGSPPPKGPGMTIRSILDEFTINPMIYENGEYREFPLLSGKETVRFSEPIGEQTLYFSIHTEPLTLGKFIPGVKRVTLKVVFPDKEISRIRPLIELGLTKTEPIRWDGKEIAPRQFLDTILVSSEQRAKEEGKEWCATLVRVSGDKDAYHTKITYEYLVEHEKKWGNTKTGVPFAIGILMLGRGQITMKGFAAPERCINPEDFIAELKKRDFVIKETIETTKIL
jgi:lysine 6-dehydrogenase